MSERTPVLVVHGVNVRKREDYRASVAELESRIGREKWRLVPVFWGDIGAKDGFVGSVIPQIGAETEVRGASGERLPPPAERSVIASLLRSVAPGAMEVRSARESADIVARAAARGRGAAGMEVRGFNEAEVRTAVLEEWPRQSWLPLLRDEAALEQIGRAIREGIADERAGGEEVRGAREIASAVRRVMGAIDRAVGAVIGLTLGNLNQYLRREAGPTVARFLGDIFVYESAHEQIRARLLEAVSGLGGDWGSAERPVTILAHSLGGLVVFDTATDSAETLAIDKLLTFGSQPAFFHVVNKRAALPLFEGSQLALPVPPRVRRWLNVWEPLDLLAFLVSPVFRLATGEAVEDRMLPHSGSDSLWGHSVYWTSEAFAAICKEFLES